MATSAVLSDLDVRARASLPPSSASIAIHLTSAQNAWAEAQEAHNEGELDHAYLRYKTFTLLVRDRIPTHKHFQTSAHQTILKLLEQDCQTAESKLEMIRLVIVQRAKNAQFEVEQQEQDEKHSEPAKTPSVDPIPRSDGKHTPQRPYKPTKSRIELFQQHIPPTNLTRPATNDVVSSPTTSKSRGDGRFQQSSPYSTDSVSKSMDPIPDHTPSLGHTKTRIELFELNNNNEPSKPGLTKSPYIRPVRDGHFADLVPASATPPPTLLAPSKSPYMKPVPGEYFADLLPSSAARSMPPPHPTLSEISNTKKHSSSSTPPPSLLTNRTNAESQSPPGGSPQPIYANVGTTAHPKLTASPYPCLPEAPPPYPESSTSSKTGSDPSDDTITQFNSRFPDLVVLASNLPTPTSRLQLPGTRAPLNRSNSNSKTIDAPPRTPFAVNPTPQPYHHRTSSNELSTTAYPSLHRSNCHQKNIIPPPSLQFTNNPPPIPPPFHHRAPSSDHSSRAPSLQPSHVYTSIESRAPSSQPTHFTPSEASTFPSRSNSQKSRVEPSAPFMPSPTSSHPTTSSRDDDLASFLGNNKQDISREFGCLENGKRLRTLFVPHKLISAFELVASPQTERDLETCGILCGKIYRGELYTTHLVIPKHESTPNTCATTNEEELLLYLHKRNLVTFGWIHTHPTQTCFMSSVDLHTHLGYQLMLDEAVAIVLSPRHKEVGVFRLTHPPGIQSITDCQEPGAFHPHPPHLKLYVSADISKSKNHEGHVVFVDQPVHVKDLRDQ